MLVSFRARAEGKARAHVAWLKTARSFLLEAFVRDA